MPEAYEYIIPTGVITSDAAVVQAEIEEEYKEVLGANLNVDADTPQGMLITADSVARISVADSNAQLANQFNPNISGGIFLQALMALLGSFTTSGTPSIVLATIAGVAGTVIAAGSQASETVAGAIFSTTEEVVIPAEGTLPNVEFQSLVNGPVECGAGNLTQIISDILGWETVTNPAAATPGTLNLSDSQIRNLRKQTLAAQGMGAAVSMLSRLYLTTGVTSATFQENTEATTEVINGVTMTPKSLYTCVGGTASSIDIATALTRSKNDGCGYNNGLGIPVSEPITVPFSGQVINVLFDRPSIVSIAVEVTVQALSSVQDLSSAVKNAVEAYANGEVSNMPGFVVGANVSPSQIAAGIAQEIPGIYIEQVRVAVQSFTQQGTLTSSSVSVTDLTYNSSILVGMAISGEGVPASTNVATLVGDTGITMSNAATESGSTLLKFTQAITYQVTAIDIEVWQQAFTIGAYVTVIIV